MMTNAVPSSRSTRFTSRNTATMRAMYSSIVDSRPISASVKKESRWAGIVRLSYITRSIPSRYSRENEPIYDRACKALRGWIRPCVVEDCPPRALDDAPRAAQMIRDPSRNVGTENRPACKWIVERPSTLNSRKCAAALPTNHQRIAGSVHPCARTLDWLRRPHPTSCESAPLTLFVVVSYGDATKR